MIVRLHISDSVRSTFRGCVREGPADAEEEGKGPDDDDGSGWAEEAAGRPSCALVLGPGPIMPGGSGDLCQSFIVLAFRSSASYGS